jgi:DNA-binding NarL/FixJ family response regulator
MSRSTSGRAAEAGITLAATGDGVTLTTAGGRRTVLASREPGLVAAAVTLVAAGYAIVRDEPVGAPSSEAVHLSPRERQVAALLLEGASNKAIARALEISVHTAKFHVTAVLDKLGARNRADAVAIIMREGLIAF